MGEHVRLRAVGAHDPSPRTLFSVKLHPPEAGASSVSRPRLHAEIDRVLADGVVVVSAPAGSGKTTLLADWARRQDSEQRVAWVTLGPPERDPARFLEYVLAALDASLADQDRGALRAALPVPDEVDEAYLAAVAQRLAGVSVEITLVLDDFHHVIGSTTERLLRRILRHSVEHVRLVVGTRRQPSLGQTKLRLRGRLRELGPAKLALTLDETAELARLRGIHDLTPADITTLHDRTQGWATGLEVVLSSMDPRPGDELVDRAARTARQLVADFLDVEVLVRQPPEVVGFLRRVATVDGVCGDLADALTRGRGGAGTLADLSQDGLFLEPDAPLSDERCTWYRWNPLVAAVLRSQLKDRDPDLAADLHDTAARWFRTHGSPVNAVRHALAAGDVDTASAVLASSWFVLAATGEGDALRSLLPLVDEARLADDPELAVIGAFSAALDHDLPRAALLAREAQDGAARLPGARRLAVEAASAAVRLRCAAMTGQPDTADVYPAALTLLERITAEHRPGTRLERTRRTLLLHALGSFELSQWHYAEATYHLSDALSEAASLGLSDLLPRIRAQLATVEVFTGRLELASTGAADVIEVAHRGGRLPSQGHAAAHLAVAAVDLHRGAPEAALDSLALARVACHPLDRVGDVRIRLLRHAALLLNGRTSEADDELEQLHETLGSWDAPPDWVRLLAAVADSDQQRVTGRPDRAVAVLEPAASLATEPLANQVWRTAYAQALLDAGRPSDARTLLTGIDVGNGNRPLEVERLLLGCLVAERLELPDESLHDLTRAVRLSRRERIVRPFLLRPEVRPLLESLLETGTGYEDHVRELLSLMPAAGPREGAEQLVDPLTTRETEVLRALRGTATNEQVAGQLYVSLNTLRSHIKQINRKLGTTSRREAVSRARRLGLI